MASLGYNNNPNLPRIDYKHAFTQYEVDEFIKCANDPVYFARKYIKIINVDRGLIPFEMWDFQEKMIETFHRERFSICKLPRQVGKCFELNTVIKIRENGVVSDITVGELYARFDREVTESPRLQNKEAGRERFLADESERKRLQAKSERHRANVSRLSDTIERKFVDCIELDEIEVFTDSGWKSATHLYKTVEYDEWILETESHRLVCADDHIVFRSDGTEVFVKNLKIDDEVLTENGVERVVSVIKTDKKSHMFDLTVDSDEHRFYTNGILSHNTTTSVAYLLHAILFNENYNVAILANKAATAREIMGRLQLAFEYLPRFLQQSVVEWNKGSIELGNGSKALADSTSSSSVRGRSFNIILLDEFAFIPNNIAEAFFMSTYPTISSGKTTKVIIVSTPNSLNLFYRMWTDAVEKRSDYVPIEIHWSMVPGRDEAWKEQTIRNTSEDQFRQEFECHFIGSTNTLIHPSKLSSLVWHNPVQKDGFLDIYKEPEPNHVYCMTVDVAEGQNLDYSAFSIFDVTSIPYRQVAKYRNNTITPLLFPTVIFQAAKKYNDAFVLVEINSIGLQVADILHHELAYENLIKIEMKGKQGQQHTPGFKKKIAFGLKTTHQTKITGCANLKTLIESDKLIINDVDTIMELTTFSADKKSFKAEEGNTDDLVMTLVHFGWLTSQRYFKENINNDIRQNLQKEQMDLMDTDLVPFGFIDDGVDNDPFRTERDADGELWVADRQRFNTFDNIEWDTLSNRHKL